jgi:hypothetical protein
MQTSIRVTATHRDALAVVAKDVGGSMDDALEVLLFEHRALLDIARLEADPQALADYQREAREWAELDTAPEDR